MDGHVCPKHTGANAAQTKMALGESRASLQEGTMLYLLAWIFLDVGVVYSFSQDAEGAAWYEYMTNQVWIYVTVAKLAFMLCLACASCHSRPRQNHPVVWCAVTVFVGAGCAQVGVLFTFFTLNFYDDTLLDTMHRLGHSLAAVILWNHARHVTVCFLHLLVYFGERRFIGHVLHDDLGQDRSLQPAVALAVAVGTAWGIGIAHTFFFNDYEIYMFTSTALRGGCMVVYALSSLVAGMYFVHGPAQTTFEDFCNPTRNAYILGCTLAVVELTPLNVGRSTIARDGHATEPPPLCDGSVLSSGTVKTAESDTMGLLHSTMPAWGARTKPWTVVSPFSSFS